MFRSQAQRKAVLTPSSATNYPDASLPYRENAKVLLGRNRRRKLRDAKERDAKEKDTIPKPSA
jgi:hypothetical protein